LFDSLHTGLVRRTGDARDSRACQKIDSSVRVVSSSKAFIPMT